MKTTNELKMEKATRRDVEGLPNTFGLVVFMLAMMAFIIPIILVLIYRGVAAVQNAEDPNLEICEVSEMGRKFTLVFMENYQNGSTPQLEIYPASRQPREVQLALNWSFFTPSSTLANVEPYTQKTINVPSVLQMFDVEQNIKAISVEASDKIGIYAMSKLVTSCDGFTVFPHNLLGTNHFVITFFPQDRETQMAFVAIENNTTVRLTLRRDTRPPVLIKWNKTTYRSGFDMNFNLSQNEAIHLSSSGDMTGCNLTSNNPIAVFSGNDLTRVEEDLFTQDLNFLLQKNHLVEQMPDVRHWGTSFYLVPFLFRFNLTLPQPGYYVKFVCLERNTSITVYSSNANNLTSVMTNNFTCENSGDFFSTFAHNVTGMAIRASLPILVAQMFASSEEINPSMTLITPVEKYNSLYTFPTAKSDASRPFVHYLQLISLSDFVSDVYMDGKPLSSSTVWNSFLDGSGFVWTSFEIEEGIHTISSLARMPVGAVIVGHSKIAAHCGYAYPAGLCF